MNLLFSVLMVIAAGVTMFRTGDMTLALVFLIWAGVFELKDEVKTLKARVGLK